MELGDFLGPNPIIIDLCATNRWDAIDELINALVAAKRLLPDQRDTAAALVKKREELMSTGIGYGVGIPHASSTAVREVVTAIGRSRAGIQFDAVDGQPVKLVIFFLTPQGEPKKHLHVLANIARLLQRTEYREGLWRRFFDRS